jgi:RNA polymerase sigma-70 factor (ECF subfamily)
MLYERVEHVVTGALLQVLGRGDRDHQDLAQIALERVVVSVFRGGFDGRCSLATWASVIATRIAVDALRRRRTERRVFSDAGEDVSEIPSAPHQRPDAAVDADRKLDALRSALGKISPDKAETIVLFEVMGHELSEIAELMGVSVAAAQSRLVRGRKELREHIEKLLGSTYGL